MSFGLLSFILPDSIVPHFNINRKDLQNKNVRPSYCLRWRICYVFYAAWQGEKLNPHISSTKLEKI
jgi:hypothetical protein